MLFLDVKVRATPLISPPTLIVFTMDSLFACKYAAETQLVLGTIKHTCVGPNK